MHLWERGRGARCAGGGRGGRRCAESGARGAWRWGAWRVARGAGCRVSGAVRRLRCAECRGAVPSTPALSARRGRPRLGSSPCCAPATPPALDSPPPSAVPPAPPALSPSPTPSQSSVSELRRRVSAAAPSAAALTLARAATAPSAAALRAESSERGSIRRPRSSRRAA